MCRLTGDDDPTMVAMSFVALALVALLVWLHARVRRRALSGADEISRDLRAQVVADTTAWTVAGAVAGIVMLSLLALLAPIGLAGVSIVDRAAAGVILALGCSVLGSAMRPMCREVAMSLRVKAMTVYAGACFLLAVIWLAVGCIVIPRLSPSVLAFLTITAVFAALEWLSARRGDLHPVRRTRVRIPQLRG